METKNIMCIICPLSCNIDVYYEDAEIIKVSGYKCKRGRTYAIAEVLNPQRILTSTVFVDGIDEKLAVKTETAIPKEKLFDAMAIIKNIKLKLPIKMGDIIVENIADTGINLIASMSVNL